MEDSTIDTDAGLTSGRLLVRNVFWNGVGEIGPLVAAFIAMPILIHHLGTERFGMIALAWTVFSYFSLFDFGISSALTKLASDRLAADRGDEVPALIGTSLILMTALGIFGSALLGLFTPMLVGHLFKVPAELHTEALRAFHLLVIALPICLTLTAFTATLAAYQRFDLINLVQSPNAMFSSLGPLAVLPFSHSIVPIIGVLVAGHAVTWFVYFAMCARAVPRMAARMRIRFGLIPELIGFGAWAAGSNVIGLLGGSFDRFVLASMASMSALTYYVVPARILHKLRIFPSIVTRVMFPALTYSLAQDRAQSRILFERGTKTLFVIMFPIALVAVAFAHELLSLWVGPEFAAHTAVLVQLLAVAALIESLARMPGSLLWAAHRPDLSTKIQVVEQPIYLVFMFVMVYLHGALGAAIACAVRSVAGTAATWIVARTVLPDVARGGRRLGWFALAAGVGLLLVALPSPVEIRIGLVCAELVILTVASWHGLLDGADRAMLVRSIWGLAQPTTIR
ncbi:MAG: flippase, partial [Candidatus Binataceae bacterium]